MSQSDFVTRGQALVTAGQYQEAVKVCRLGLLGRPTTVEGRVVLGQALLALKRYDEVLAEMRVALELDHTSVTAQVLKGEALLRKGDAQAALEVLQRVRSQAPTDPRIAGLLDEAERAAGRPRMSAVHPAVGFVAPQPGAPIYPTKAYVPHAAEDDDEDTGPADEDTGGSYTRPTSLSAPGAKKRSTPHPAQPAGRVPPPAVLAVGDRSGTVEVDPELDGVEVSDDDFSDVASPPIGGRPPKPVSGARGAVMAATRSPKPQARRKGPQKEISTVELDDDEMIEVDETAEPVMKRPSPASAVRAAVKMPSGPIDALPPHSAPPAHLAQMIASNPHVMQVQPVPYRGNPINAALPTAIAPVPAGFQAPPPQPLPPAPLAPAANPYAQTMLPQPVPQLPVSPAAALPTMAVGPMGQPLPPAQQPAYNGDPGWSQRAAANEPTGMAQPPVEPMLAAMFDVASLSPNDSSISQGSAKAMKTGVRRGRSKLQIALWVLLGALVIGGGVVVGFKIRAMRLDEQIQDARDEAVALAKQDTWKGWVGARDRLAGIAQASATVDNLAALAHARALVAYEFGDGYGEAKVATDALGEDGGGLEGHLARAYLALAESNAKAARTAADAASDIDAEMAAVLHVTGEAQLLAGDIRTAITTLKKAADKEARPRYVLALARAYGAATMWDEAIAAADRALQLSPDHPGALIERAMLNAHAGRVIAAGPLGAELRTKLEKVVAEGAQPYENQQRGVSPAQVAFADLALARVDHARGDVAAAVTDVRNALAIQHDELRFAEEVVDTIFATSTPVQAQTAAEAVLEKWPESRRARTALAEILLAQQKNLDARDAIAKLPTTQLDPRAFTVRAQIHIANGDVDAARKDFEEAIKRAPPYEDALVGLAWLDLASNDVDAARKRIEARYKEGAPPAIAAVYAAILRASNEADARDKAKAVLEAAVKGVPTSDNARAWLELARLHRDIGGQEALRSARGAYENAAKYLPDAKLESALLLIEDRSPDDGRKTLEHLYKEAGDKASAQLLVELARARMLVGDHEGALALFPKIEKTPGVVKWKLARERGRYFLRKGDYAGAAQQLLVAIEQSGDDGETFLLAADTGADGNQPKLLERVKELAPKRLKGRPEADIVQGKIALADGDAAAAMKHYETAAKAFDANKATPRRIAQASYGIGVAAYLLQNDPVAKGRFEYVIEQDPSNFAAYLYLGDMEKNPKKALEYARRAVTVNPDLVEGWVMVGTNASRLRDRKTRQEAIQKVGALAPNSDALRALQRLP